MAVPTTTKRWTVQGKGEFDNLSLDSRAEVPRLGDHDILVKFHAASLNYRDLIIVKGLYPFPHRDGVIPGSDGAGEVWHVGPRVSRFAKGDRVVTLFNQGHLGGPLDPKVLGTGTGGLLDGALTEFGVFDENALVEMPRTLTWEEASTLSCAALTAWNALYGLDGKSLKPGDVVLTQGTGGVSLFALQFAAAAGATVIATTSSDEKMDLLKSLGAHYVLNYKTDPNWGETAKSLTAGKTGVTNIIEVGGPTSMRQSLAAVKMDGLISVVGFLGGAESASQPSFLDTLMNLCTVRGVIVGSRIQFENMNQAIDATNLKPVVDGTVWNFDQLKDAYQYMWDQKHFGKVVVRISN